jgi:hypothetical protein
MMAIPYREMDGQLDCVTNGNCVARNRLENCCFYEIGSLLSIFFERIVDGAAMIMQIIRQWRWEAPESRMMMMMLHNCCEIRKMMRKMFFFGIK